MNNLSRLDFVYPNDGSLKIDLVSDNPVYSFQINTIGLRTTIYIRGALSKLLPSYLVRNSFDVEVHTRSITDVVPGVELTIIAPPGASVLPAGEPGKTSFIVRLDQVRPAATYVRSQKRDVTTTAKNRPRAEPVAKISAPPAVVVSKPFGTKEITATDEIKNLSAKVEDAASGNKKDQPASFEAAAFSPIEKPKSLPRAKTSASDGDVTGKGTIQGNVTDERGAIVVGASVSVINKNGFEQKVETDSQGFYEFKGLSPGMYILRATGLNFAEYVSGNIEVVDRSKRSINITLKVNVLTAQVVTTDPESVLNNSLENTATSRIITGSELNTLPEDPAALSMALQSITAASGVPGSAEIIVDGFAGGRIPPKKAIKEIKINKDPYSAEFNRPGNVRIEIITKPGMDQFNGGLTLGYNDHRLNTRDPFASSAIPYQSRDLKFFFGGPFKKQRASFFLNYENGSSESPGVITAAVLDQNFDIVPLNQSVPASQRSNYFTSRFDVQLDNLNTLVGRYSISRSSNFNYGAGGFSLLSTAYDGSHSEHTLQFAETAVLSPRSVTETRSQYVFRTNERRAAGTGLRIDVPGAFDSGPSFGINSSTYHRLDTGNITTVALKNHTFRMGIGARYVKIFDSTSQNFPGSYRFDGSIAPQLDPNLNIIRDSNGIAIMSPITGLERYRRTLQFQRLGLTPQQIRERGGGASRFSITTGSPDASISQYEIYGFLQDVWRVRPNLTLGLGARIESQNNIGDNLNIAPRFSFAWSPRGKGNGSPAPGLVVRGGIGFFYEPFSEFFSLRARRLNGLSQRQFSVTDPTVLDNFPVVPDQAMLAGTSQPAVAVEIDPALNRPLSIQANIGFEKQLPMSLVLSTQFQNVRTNNALRSRYFPSPQADVFRYESSGRFDQKQLSFTLTRRLSQASFYATYSFTKAKSDTDGPDSLIYDDGDYSRAASNIRHSLYLGAWLRPFYEIDISPLIIYRSGLPFNIISGRDLNSDTVLNDRPAFATDLSRPSVVRTSFGNFDLDPVPGQVIIPRNFGTSEGFLTVNLNVTRTFTFFGEANPTGSEPQRFLGFRAPKRPVQLTLSVYVENLFNRTNAYLPEGNLSSQMFGRSFTSAGAYGFGSYAPGNRIIRPYISLTF